MGLLVFLWSLLLFVPGIIAAYSYSLTFFIIADEPGVGVTEAIRRSKLMMQGNKWKLLCLQMRFFWWALLCELTLGIGLLWLVPTCRRPRRVSTMTSETPRPSRSLRCDWAAQQWHRADGVGARVMNGMGRRSCLTR